MVDLQRIHQWNKKSGFINLYFDYEDRSHNGTQQVAYPCYGKHYSGKTTDNQKVLNLYQISSGPRENSIMVYTHLSYQRDYKIRRIHENVNLKGLLPTGPYYPREEEAGPSEPAGKRIKTEQTVLPDISYPLPAPSTDSLTTTPQLVQPVWEQRYPFQRTYEPSPNQSLVYSFPTAGQRPATAQLNPAHQIPSRDQPIQAAGLPYQTSTASQQLTPSHIGSSQHFLNPDLQFAIKAEGLPYQPQTTGQQPTPPKVRSSYYVPSQDQQPVIPAVGPSILSPDKMLEAYSSEFLNIDETDQQLSVEDYGLDYFTEISDQKPLAGGGLLADALIPFSKNDPGPSEDP